MNKKPLARLAVGLLGLSLANGAGAALMTVGTATYSGTEYKLIYDNDLHISWLDYTKDSDVWQAQMNWASNLGAILTVNLLPGYTSTNNWATDWRLPITGNPQTGNNITTSEMGHLYYTELGNKDYYDINGHPQTGYGLVNTGNFDHLVSYVYWSSTEYAGDPSKAILFATNDGGQWAYGKDELLRMALAVRPGEVSAVPVPGAVWLVGSGLVGLASSRLKRKKN